MSIRSQKLPIGSQTKDISVKFSIIKLSNGKKGEKNMRQRFWKTAAMLVLAMAAISKLTISQWGWYQPEED